jgi:DNA-binding transcriptional LysR family regulator
MFGARDLPLLAVFAAVSRLGSFTAAARELGVSKSVVSEQVRTLEERLAVRLIERSTRRLRLTQVGEQVLGAAAPVVGAGAAIDGILEQHRRTPVGTLRVAATHDLGARLVAPIAARLARQHPQLRIDLVCDDAVHDLIAGRFDLAVRLGAPRDSNYVMRRLAEFDEPIVGAPALAAAWSGATRPRELASAPFVRHALLGRPDVWRFTGPRGEVDEVRVTLRGQANTGDGVRALVLGGVGLGALPDYWIEADLRRGALVRLCPGWIWKRVSLYAVLPSARRLPKRAELFLAALKESFPRASLAPA